MFVCPACGYPGLTEAPWRESTGASHEICPSCCIQFGHDDDAGGDEARRLKIYSDWRPAWFRAGMPWRSVGIPQPSAWNPRKQVKRVIAFPWREFMRLMAQSMLTVAVKVTLIMALSFIPALFFGFLLMDAALYLCMKSPWPELAFCVGAFPILYLMDRLLRSWTFLDLHGRGR